MVNKFLLVGFDNPQFFFGKLIPTYYDKYDKQGVKKASEEIATQ